MCVGVKEAKVTPLRVEERQTDSVLRDKAEPTALTEKAEQRGSVPRAHTASLRGKRDPTYIREIIDTVQFG